MELGTGFLRNCENCLDANGMSFLILSAIETKYLLKESEMTVGSDVGVLSTLRHIGDEEAEERREIRDLTPSQTLPMYFWLSLKNLWKKLLLLNLQSDTILFLYFLKLSSKRVLRSGSFFLQKTATKMVSFLY